MRYIRDTRYSWQNARVKGWKEKKNIKKKKSKRNEIKGEKIFFPSFFQRRESSRGFGWNERKRNYTTIFFHVRDRDLNTSRVIRHSQADRFYSASVITWLDFSPTLYIHHQQHKTAIFFFFPTENFILSRLTEPSVNVNPQNIVFISMKK